MQGPYHPGQVIRGYNLIKFLLLEHMFELYSLRRRKGLKLGGFYVQAQTIYTTFGQSAGLELHFNLLAVNLSQRRPVQQG